MIVKNEAKLIQRCLESVRPLVDYISISDTGSTDGTQQIIFEYLSKHGIPGLVRQDQWHDFAWNRNVAISAMNGVKNVDYLFVIDADDTLEIAKDFDVAAFKASLDKDVYDVMVRHGGVVHPRPQLFRNRPGYFFVGVLHEFLEVSEKPFSRATAPGLTVNASIEGSRNADPLKFQKDAALLRKALETEKHEYLRARYIFYLAQSYRDAGMDEDSVYHYIECSKMGIWDQQVYASLVEAIRCCIRLKMIETAEECFARTRKEFSYLNRVEADHAMARLYREFGKNEKGMQAAAGRWDIAIPDGLFVEPWIYDYGLRDEYAVNAYWCGRYTEALVSNLELLRSKKLPCDAVPRIADNAMACWAKIKDRYYVLSD